MDKATAAGYLAGMIDGEGTVSAPGRPRYVSINNTDRSLIDACVVACEVLGITATVCGPYKRNTPGRKPYWRVGIQGRDDLEKLASTVPIHSVEKKERLRAALESYSPTMSAFHRLRDLPMAEIYDLRRQGLTFTEIGARFGVTRGAVGRWFRAAGVKTPAARAGCRGERNPKAKLTMEQAREIRRNTEGLSDCEIARRYGVSNTLARRIRIGLAYREPESYAEAT